MVIYYVLYVLSDLQPHIIRAISMSNHLRMRRVLSKRRRCDKCTQLSKQGATIFVEKLNAQEGEEVVFDKVVVYANRTTRVGTPYVKGVKVNAKVEKQGKGKKITIFKYKAKKGSSRRKQGHRQPYTKLTVTSIEA